MPVVENVEVRIADLTRESAPAGAQALAEAFSRDPFLGFFLSRRTLRRWWAIVLGWILRARLTAGKPAYAALAGNEVVGVVGIEPRRKSRRARAGYWRIFVLGVRPSWQGRGVGRALMARAHTLCDADSGARGVYLSTVGSRNRSFYESLGYKVISHIRFGRQDLYRMVRPAPHG